MLHDPPKGFCTTCTAMNVDLRGWVGVAWLPTLRKVRSRMYQSQILQLQALRKAKAHLAILAQASSATGDTNAKPEDWKMCRCQMFLFAKLVLLVSANERHGYIPNLYSTSLNCCSQNDSAQKDEQIILMCQTCAYDVSMLEIRGRTYEYFQNDVLLYDMTCSTTCDTDTPVNCVGSYWLYGTKYENETRYGAECQPNCITRMAHAYDGYVPTLYSQPPGCCSHTAPWDDQFTLM